MSLEVSKRELFGKKIKKLRKQGIVPGNIYGKGINSTAIQFPVIEFKKLFKEAGETQIVELSLSGEKKPISTLITDVQVDPINRELLHVDFRQVDLTKKITASIPVELVGESPAQGLGLLLITVKDEVEVEALPTDFPDQIEVNVLNLKEVNDVITVKDLKVDTKTVTILDDPEEVIVKVQEPQKEEVEKAPEAEEAAADSEAKPEEATAADKEAN